jgi:Leucine-rich repeat (LRR) protein
LERLEHQLTDNIETIADEIDLLTMVREAKNYAEREGKDQGIRLTQAMVLENSMCDELREIRTLMLRDKKIKIFEDDPKQGFDFTDMCNIECLFASHNQISDITGVCQLITLVELNLSFNFIQDISGIQELTMLRSLFLNHNRIVVIDAIENLKSLKQLSLFHN